MAIDLFCGLGGWTEGLLAEGYFVIGFDIWGDVPALMPMAAFARKFNPDGTQHGQGSWFKIANSKNRGATKNADGSWFAVSHNNVPHSRGDEIRIDPDASVKHAVSGHAWWRTGMGGVGSKGSKRKAASALIAKIPLVLSRHIGAVYHPSRLAA